MSKQSLSSRWVRPTATIIAAVTLAAALFACGGAAPDGDDEGDDDRPAPVARISPDFVPMAADVVRTAGIEYGKAGAGTIFDTVELQGSITTDPQRVRHVQARYPGVVRDVRVRVGETVAAGTVLATVESDESLQSYPIRSPIAGVLSDLATAPGDHAGDRSMMTIVDLSHVWVEVPLFASDVRAIRNGMPVRVRADNDGAAVDGEISYISPIGTPGNQTTSARVVIDNQDGRWIPGMGVVVQVRRSARQVPVVVRRDAVQRYEGRAVVFVKSEGGFRLQAVTPGVDDGENVEIHSGLKEGDVVAVTNSYVVLAELEKGSMSDDD